MKKKNAIIALLIAAVLLTVAIALVACKSSAAIKLAKTEISVVEGLTTDLGLSVEGELKSSDVIKVDIIAGADYIKLEKKSGSEDYTIKGTKAGSPALVKITLNNSELWANVTVTNNPEIFSTYKSNKLAELEGYAAVMAATDPYYAAFVDLKQAWKTEINKADNADRIDALLDIAKGLLGSFNSSYIAYGEEKITKEQLDAQIVLFENQTDSYGALIENYNEAIVSLHDLINRLIGKGDYASVIPLSEAVKSLNVLTTLQGADIQAIFGDIDELERIQQSLQDQIDDLQAQIEANNKEINSIKYNGVAVFIANDYSYIYDGTQHDFKESVQANIKIAEAAYGITSTGLRFEIYNSITGAFEAVKATDIVNAGIHHVKIIAEFNDDGEGFALSTVSIAKATPGHPAWPTVTGEYSYYTRLGDVEFTGGSPGEGNASESELIGYFEWKEPDRLIEPINYGFYMRLIPFDTANYNVVEQLFVCNGKGLEPPIPMCEAYAVIVPDDGAKHYDGKNIDPYTITYGIEVYGSKAHYDAIKNGTADCTSDKDICLTFSYDEIIDLIGRNAVSNNEKLFMYVYDGLMSKVGAKDGEIDRAKLFTISPDNANVGTHVISTKYTAAPGSLYSNKDAIPYHVYIASLSSNYTISTVYIAAIEGVIAEKVYDESASVVIKGSEAFANVAVSNYTFACVVTGDDFDFTDTNNVKYKILQGHTVTQEALNTIIFGIKGNYVDKNVATADAQGVVVDSGAKKDIKEVTAFSREFSTNFGIPEGRFTTGAQNLFDYFKVTGKIVSKSLVMLTGDIGEENYKAYDATAAALKNEITIGFNSVNFNSAESGMYAADWSKWSIKLNNGEYVAYLAINNLAGKNVYYDTNGNPAKKYAAFDNTDGEWELLFAGAAVEYHNYVYNPAPVGAAVPHGTPTRVFFNGKINPLRLDGTFYNSNLEARKQYDGNSNVYLNNFVGTPTISLSAFTLTSHSFDKTVFNEDVITFVKANVGNQDTVVIGNYRQNLTLAAKDVGTKSFDFTVGNIILTGEDFKNYDWTGVTFVGDGEITKRELVLESNLEFATRTYNAKTAAYASDFLTWLPAYAGHYNHTLNYLYMDSSLVTISNFVDGESALIALILNGGAIPNAKYNNKNVGVNKLINWEQAQWAFVTDNSSHGLAEQIAKSANMNNYDWSNLVLTATGTITKATIDNISGITSQSREYDGTADAQLKYVNTTDIGAYTGVASGNIAYNGRFSDDNNITDNLYVRITGDGVFQNLTGNDAKNATTNKQIFYYDYEILGDDANNYDVSVSAGYVQGTGDITKKTITAVTGIVSWRTTEGYGAEYGNYTLPEAKYNDITQITFVGIIGGDTLTFILNSRGKILNYFGKAGIYETEFDMSTIAIKGSANTSVEDYDISGIVITGICFVYEPDAIPEFCPTLNDYNKLVTICNGFNLSYEGEEGTNNNNTIIVGNGAEVQKDGDKYVITLALELPEGLKLSDISGIIINSGVVEYSNGIITITVDSIDELNDFDMQIKFFRIDGFLYPPVLFHVSLDFDLIP